ncbi:hypothetical protein [Saccharibacillus sp. JS10]|uniref:hypothetical protein n=1 Tax=Saccharibacillus sp. JS10 TaxID=2950552 RepID=UPI00210A232E|nr:hypothetical protein [Saccharibacillus sp. JS10]MCQ4088283.1 hypothetical protein [Saccharibacillus sp. JS10]
MQYNKTRMAVWTIGTYVAGLALVLLAVQQSNPGMSIFYIVLYAVALLIGLLRIPGQQARDTKFVEDYEQQKNRLGFWQMIGRQSIKVLQYLIVAGAIMTAFMYVTEGVNLVSMLLAQSWRTLSLFAFVMASGVFLFSIAVYANQDQKYEGLRKHQDTQS